MRRRGNISSRRNEGGVVITLIAIIVLFVVGAMAAISVDVVTLYTARSEAQLAADSAALAGARVLANSGMTSSDMSSNPTLTTSAEALATTIATQVASNNLVGGRNLIPGGTCPGQEICVSFNNTSAPTNPHITVNVQRADLPTFFARIWGRTVLAVAASATAEAYNPTYNSATSTGNEPPVAPTCVKPWVLPNLDPNGSGSATIFNADGSISDSALLGWTSTTTLLTNACETGSTCNTPTKWQFYPGDTTTTFAPPSSYPTCAPALTTPYEQSIGGCVPVALACNGTADIVSHHHPNQTTNGVNCLTHSAGNGGDTVTVTPPLPPTTAIEFVAGADNPFVLTGALTAPADIMVSDSLVTVPVFSNFSPPPSSVTIIGFVQLFLNPNGQATPPGDQVMTTVINMAGCGTVSGQAILGNGASPVAVRLISPP